MKKLLFPLIVIATVIFMVSCETSKQVAYFQNIDSVSLSSPNGLYDARIMPKDMLTITVSTTDPAASAPFNLTVSNQVGANGQLNRDGGTLQGYLVDNNGNINFPVIGRIHVLGMTKTQCQDVIKSKLIPYMASTENPIVTVRMSSYRITVTGEVNRPGVIPVTTEKISVLEALAHAGDLTIYGRRDNIILIREHANGQKESVRLNLNDANLLNSPYYYLQQNDVIYVQPNNTKSKSSDIGPSTTMWFSLVGIATSLTSLLVNILR